MENFADEMKQIEYLKKLEQNQKELNKAHQKRMRGISAKQRLESSMEKVNSEAKNIISEIGGIHKEFSTIVVAKQMEQKVQISKKTLLKGESSSKFDQP